jgi:hypothetical protein
LEDEFIFTIDINMHPTFIQLRLLMTQHTNTIIIRYKVIPVAKTSNLLLRKQSRAFLFQSLTKAFFIGLKAIDRKT